MLRLTGAILHRILCGMTSKRQLVALQHETRVHLSEETLDHIEQSAREAVQTAAQKGQRPAAALVVAPMLVAEIRRLRWELAQMKNAA